MQPCQTALSVDRTVMAVADSGNNRVQLFDAKTRKYITSFGKKGQIKPGRMERPEGVAFVNGRQEIIVADTGNNRLQIFHVEQLTTRRKEPPKVVNSDGEKNVRVTSSPGELSLSMTTAIGSLSGTRSWMAYAQAQAPVQTSMSEARLQEAGGGPRYQLNRTTNARGLQLAVPGGGEETNGDHNITCLLVFTGAENRCRLRKRRTAGESEDGEGPLRQPCDISFWKAHKAEEDTPWAWSAFVPPWFRFWDGSSPTAKDAEMFLLQNTQGAPNSGSSEKNAGPKMMDQDRSGGARGVSDSEDNNGRPVVGSFVVCETATPGELQLFFVDKTKETVETVEAPEKEQDDDDIPQAMSRRKSAGDPEQGLQESKDLRRTHIAEEAGSGEEENHDLKLSLLSNALNYEVRHKTITVLDEARRIVIDNRTYGSLLVLLRAFRGRGFTRLSGVFDTRGDRGIVAVAERGGGRVRMLHYTPAFPPFYQTELTHLHSIEGLQRPCSVSFNMEGDLLITDEGAQKVLVYGHLSGTWVQIHSFGPNCADRNNFEMCTSGREGRGRVSAVTGQRRYHRRQISKDVQLKWGLGIPVSSLFTLGGVNISAGDSLCCEVRTALVVATSDGNVRAFAGPVKRNCGRFAELQEDTALSIFEMLGYRSSQVLVYVNRTTAEMRARLRQEWRLFPLTQRRLSKIKMEFLQWGRSSTGQGLPGRGTAVDAEGKRLCNDFLVTSKCSRPACPYSHEQPWIEEDLEKNESAYILFRGGVTHVLNNLYGQVFVWEWEGDLYRLFRDRSMSKTIVKRRDPMTLGIYGAEAVRDCVEEERQVLDYHGFIEFTTVIHEHMMYLRSWNQRTTTLPTTTSLETIQRVREDTAPLLTSDEGFVLMQDRTLPPPTQLCNDVVGLVREGIDATEAACIKTFIKQEKEDRRQNPMVSGSGGSSRPPTSDSRPLDSATPWLSWDSTRRNNYKPPTTVQYNMCGERAKSDRENVEEDEEQKVNRTYGSTEDERAASVNKIIAFQTDRVVRVLDALF